MNTTGTTEKLKLRNLYGVVGYVLDADWFDVILPDADLAEVGEIVAVVGNDDHWRLFHRAVDFEVQRVRFAA